MNEPMEDTEGEHFIGTEELKAHFAKAVRDADEERRSFATEAYWQAKQGEDYGTY